MARFEKGKSGNPSGRPKQTAEELDLINACKSKAAKALDKLEALMDSENEGIALKASLAIIERAYGKPRQEIDMTANQPPEPQKIVITYIDPKDGKEKPLGC
ncbi:MAG: hypothetical protein KIG68_04915 [Oxalobacter sp.]|nr:hypothetical protein [Oxalobacter sp.]